MAIEEIIGELKILLAYARDIREVVPAKHLNHIRREIADPNLDKKLMAEFTKNLSSNEKTKFINQILVDPTEQQKWTQLFAEQQAELQAAEQPLAAQQQEQQRVLLFQQRQQELQQQQEQQRVLLFQQQQQEQQQVLLFQQRQQEQEQNRKNTTSAAKAYGIHE